MTSIIFFFIAGACRGLAELISFKHGKSIFSGRAKPTSFFGSQAWLRKHKVDVHNHRGDAFLHPIPAPKDWYHKLFDLDYRERFLFSATVLVWLTDAFHFFNIMMKVMIIVAIISYRAELPITWSVVGYLMAWSGGFTLTYNILFQKRSLK